MCNKNSFDYYSLWKEINNENFNCVESHRIKINEVGYNRFTMTPNRWKKNLMQLELFRINDIILTSKIKRRLVDYEK